MIDVSNQEEKTEKGQRQTLKNNIYNSDSVEIQQLKERIDKKYKKYKHVSSKQGLKSFFKTLYKIRGLLIPALTHFFDTATDIALVWEFYILKDENEFDNQDIDIYAFFILSLGVLVYYRISSAFEVWQFTGKKNETLLQFLFDFFLIKLIYTNIFKMKSYQPSHVIKQFRMIEGGNESAFQAILTLVFLLKSGNFDNSVAIVSLGASLLSLISRLSILDKNCLINEAKDLKDFKLSDIFTKPKLAFGKIHKEFVLHRLFRCTEILYSIFLISIFWHFVGGEWLIFLSIIAIVNVYQQYNRSGQIRTDWFNYILVINITEVGHYFQQSFDICSCKVMIMKITDTLITLRIFYVRTIMTVVITVTVLFNDDWIFAIIILVLFVLTNILCGIIVKYWTIENLNENSVVENFRIFDYIANDNEECVWFCKYLKCDIFYQIKKISINYNGCKLETSKPHSDTFFEPNNVMEAIFRSNNVKYFEIISQWYDEVKQKNDDINDNFYSYSRKEIKIDDELLRFLLFICKNKQLFEQFLCNEMYFLDMNDDRSSEWICEIARISVKLMSPRALNYVTTTFLPKVSFGSFEYFAEPIWNELINIVLSLQYPVSDS